MTLQLAADLAVIRKARVLFTHHSVGVNILAGIEQIDAGTGETRVRMAPLEDVPAGGPALVHGGGGRNTEPKTKIDHFATLLREESRFTPDLALMKLCYVDFNPRTDVDDLFSYYRRTLEELEREHPEIQFAHVTVPLHGRQTDLKSSLRRLLRLEVWEDAANVKRSEFNRRLIETFTSDPVFDLARAESTDPDGAAITFEHAGRSTPSLYPGYTDDGGHLNASGQRAAGSAAIRFLADALRRRSAQR